MVKRVIVGAAVALASVALMAPAQAVAPSDPVFPASWNCVTWPAMHGMDRWQCVTRVDVRGVKNMAGAANTARPVVTAQAELIGARLQMPPTPTKWFYQGHRKGTVVLSFVVLIPSAVPAS
jgi:hypothetical protein